LEKTAHVFLLNLHTLQLWIRRVDEHGERELIQTRSPVNRYPDFVRHLVRQLKRLFPAMGSDRLAQILVPLTSGAVRRELAFFTEWYNVAHLGGRTPLEVRTNKRRRPRIETRSRWPHPSRSQLSGKRLALDVRYVAGRKHLPVIELRRAA